jgi:hypothetical protein
VPYNSGPWKAWLKIKNPKLKKGCPYVPYALRPVTSSSVAGLFTLSSFDVGQGHFSWLSSACGYLACGDLAYGHGPGKRRIHFPWTLLNDTWVSRLTMALVPVEILLLLILMGIIAGLALRLPKTN